MDRQSWERLGEEPEPSWYLDLIAARQKRETHLNVIRKWTAGMRVERVLKTDLFEEASGKDSLLESLFPSAETVCGLDAAFSIAKSASQRYETKIRALVCDVRNLSLQDRSVDVIVSTSTLDHFDCRADFLVALAELSHVLKPGGLLVITLDNPWNFLYYPLRWLSRSRVGPFALGYTESMNKLERDLNTMGLRPENRAWLLHNPRGVSTLLFLGLRKICSGRVADQLIHLLLRLCERLNNLPTRKVTACFVAVAARKPLEES